MVAVVELCVAHEWSPPELAHEVRAALQELGLPTDWAPLATDAMLAQVGRDKKRQGEHLTLVALPELGAGALKSCRLAPMLAMMKALAVRPATPRRGGGVR